jgi:hypothetical protein
VLDALVRRVDVVADRGANAGDLARGNRRAHTRAADEDAALRAPVPDGRAELGRLVGVVDPHCVGVRPEIDDGVPVRIECLEDLVAQMDSAVVEGDCDLHNACSYATRVRSARARATTLSTVYPNFSSTVLPGADAP